MLAHRDGSLRMACMKKILLIFLFLANMPVYAASCTKVRYLDIDSTQEIKRDTYGSSEKEKRSFLVLPNGNFLILNQHHCLISNYEIRYFFEKESKVPYKKYARNVLNILNKIVEFEKLIKQKDFDRNFTSDLEGGDFNQNHLYIQKAENDEYVNYHFEIKRRYSYPYDHEISVSISIGETHH